MNEFLNPVSLYNIIEEKYFQGIKIFIYFRDSLVGNVTACMNSDFNLYVVI